MTQRDLIATALKILGLCLVVFGLIATCNEGVRAYTADWNVQSQRSASVPKEDIASARWGSPISIAVAEAQRNQHLFAVGIGIAQILAGLYLCKKGTVILNFLDGQPQARNAGQASPP